MARDDKTDAEVELGRFEGRQVVGAGVEITNAGDGLSQALGVDPVKLSIGERVYVVLECEVKRIKFDAVKDAPSHRLRTHVLRTEAATLIDDHLVADAIEKQKIRIEEKSGVHRLDLDGTQDEPSE